MSQINYGVVGVKSVGGGGRDNRKDFFSKKDFVFSKKKTHQFKPRFGYMKKIFGWIWLTWMLSQVWKKLFLRKKNFQDVAEDLKRQCKMLADNLQEAYKCLIFLKDCSDTKLSSQYYCKNWVVLQKILREINVRMEFDWRDPRHTQSFLKKVIYTMEISTKISIQIASPYEAEHRKKNIFFRKFSSAFRFDIRDIVLLFYMALEVGSRVFSVRYEHRKEQQKAQ